MIAYLAGVATMPALALLVWLWATVTRVVAEAMGKRGWFIEIHNRNSYDRDGVDEHGWRDYDKRHAILWGNHRGPVYWGHWCRQEIRNDEWVVTRWVGFGARLGHSIAFYRKRTL